MCIIDKPYFRFNICQIHHLYYGIALMAMAIFFGGWVRLALAAVGAIVFADDLYQHIMQGYALRGKDYVSPLARLALPIYRTRAWAWLAERFYFLRNT
jgi:hypothetical protein